MRKNRLPQQIVLAYSGGLDTSFCILHLIDLGYEVHAVSVNTGGFDKGELEDLAKKAYGMGAKTYECIDITDKYYHECLRYLIYGNVLRNNTYPLSVSSERAFQAMAILQYAKKHNIHTVAHGSTGAGNDQIRFDTVFLSDSETFEIITPIRDKKLNRQEEIDYIRSKGYEWSEHKKNYSINQGLWGTSIGGKETLTSRHTLPEEAYLSKLKKHESREINIGFQNGEPISISGKLYESKVKLIQDLNAIGSDYAIGRDVHVGDTIIGIKGRIAFEAPAALMIIRAHHLLEKHTLSKWQIHWKNQLADWYGMFLHEGKYMDPVMRNIEDFLTSTQNNVNGEVYIILHPYRVELIGIESPNDLMSTKFGSYGEMNGAWTGEEAKGFTKIFSNADRIYQSVNNAKNKKS